MHVHIDRVFTTVARNLGLKDFSRYTNSWIEWSYEAEKLIGSMDTFVQKEVTYDASGAKATGTITFTSNPVSGDSITLNGVTLYFRTSSDLGEAKSPNEIRIGDTLIHTMNYINSPFGLIQSLTGLRNISQALTYNASTEVFEATYNNESEAPLRDVNTGTGTYSNAAVFSYPEALNVADYTVTENTGSDMITNGSFTGSATGWSLAGSYAYSSNAITSSAIQYAHLYQSDIGVVAYKTYRINFTISSHNTGNLTIYMISQEHTDGKYYKGQADVLSMTNGTYSVVLDTDEASDDKNWWGSGQKDTIRFSNQQSANHDFTIDDISVVEITSTQLNITAKEIGGKGNEYTLASDSANAKVNGLTLTGGKDIYRNQQIVLPEDNIKLLGVRVGTDDSDHEHVELRRTSAVHRGRVGKTNDDSQQRAFRYYVDGNRLNIQHDNLDEITIVYLAYPTDLRGWPMVKEGHETAVAQYIMWQMKLIEFYNGKLPQYITKELEKRWYFLCGKARGDDSMPTSEELSQIGKMWNTLIPVKSTRGLIDF